MTPAKAHAIPRGFSLVEVMVALIVICVGLLGIAKMQALTLSSTGASRMRALAALEASSIADAMHADRSYWGSSPPDTVTVSDTGTSGSASTGSSTQDTTLATALAASPDCTYGSSAAPCTSVNLAAYDLTKWATDMFSVLRGSTSTIACATNSTIVTCTITISWQEKTAAANAQESSTTFQNQSYQLVVNP